MFPFDDVIISSRWLKSFRMEGNVLHNQHRGCWWRGRDIDLIVELDATENVMSTIYDKIDVALYDNILFLFFVPPDW